MDKFLEKIPEFVEQGLGIDVGSLGIQLIATFILFAVVFKFLWKPMTNLLEERREIISNDLEEAKNANANAHQIKLELEERLNEAKNEAKNIIEASRERGESEKSRIVAEAEQEAANNLSKAADEISLEYQKARGNIKNEIVEVAFQVAEKIIEKEIDSSKHEVVVEDFLREVEKDA
ncbi:F0F1 ATP synthase subunit B [Mycoplasmatota bacterium]|nr:F0F1 ATP synthase subunit B [Mycoplasmatota bacterium]